MKIESLEQIQVEELQLIKGGRWVYINGEWHWDENDEGEDEGPGPGWAFD